MLSFFKSTSPKPDVPAWASYFTAEEYSSFINSIEKYFKKKNINYTISNGVLLPDNPAFGIDKLGLSNIAQICKQNKIADYINIVTHHFDSLIRSNEFDKGFKIIVEDFDKAKQYIGVRLYSSEYISHIGKENAISKDFARDLYSILVFDLPDSIVSVQPDQAAKWNKTTDELFELGIKNIKAKYPVKTSKENLGAFSIYFAQANHFFAPNILFELKNMHEFIGEGGALIGIPHRHAVLIYPINSLEVVPAINGMIPTIYGMHKEGPGSISNKLFWYKDSVFENQPYTLENDTLNFSPTEKFVEYLNTLKK